MYISDDSDEVKNEVYKICASKDISFEKVNYSFRFLFDTFKVPVFVKEDVSKFSK
jgi:hypothetical protein